MYIYIDRIALLIGSRVQFNSPKLAGSSGMAVP